MQSRRATPQEKKQINLYVLLMCEVNDRLEVVDSLRRNSAKLSVQTVRELCYLQFRYLCELVALGCIVAHGTTSKKIISAYQADKIISGMTKLNAEFFPLPSRWESKNHAHRIIDKSDSYHLTKEDLSQLWRATGDLLHRTPFTKLVGQQPTYPSDLSDVIGYSIKFIGLLSTHRIQLSDMSLLLIQMKIAGTELPMARFIRWSIDGAATIYDHKAI